MHGSIGRSDIAREYRDEISIHETSPVKCRTQGVGPASRRRDLRFSGTWVNGHKAWLPNVPISGRSTGRDSRRRAWRAPVAASEQSVCARSEEHTSELQSLMRISYAVFCLQTKKPITTHC